MNSPTNAEPALGQEWVTLQNNYEQYEKTALLIKLIAIVLCAIGLVFDLILIGGIIAILLWVQEGIFKAYQSRLGARLIRIEVLVKRPDSTSVPFQLHTEWLASRKSVAGLLAEYAATIVKPTVAFPYAVLLLLNLIVYTGWLS